MVQEKRKLLQTWVAEGENRNQCESRVIISRESAFISRGDRELISIRDMILQKNWPVTKIKGVVLKGGGVPDQDAPQDPTLTAFWVTTKRLQREEDSSRTRSETQIAAQTTRGGVAALMALPSAPSGTATVSSEQLDQILRSTEPPSASAAAGAHPMHSWCHMFC